MEQEHYSKTQSAMTMMDFNFNKVLDNLSVFGIEKPVNNRLILDNAREILISSFKQLLAAKGEEFFWVEEYEEVAEWLADNKGKGIILMGSCGKGKSLLCRYIIPAIYNHFHRKVVNVYDIQRMNREIDEVLTKRFVSLDDIGTESEVNIYGNKRYAFPEIIDIAEKKGNLLFISTNLNGKHIQEKYDIRTYDRIFTTCKVVKFKGNTSFRQQK